MEGHTEAKTLRSTTTRSSPQDSPKRGTQLLWLKGHLNGQPLDMMLDSGATVCCLAKRCFEASSNLKHERLIPYNGPGLLDANGNFLTACGVIKEPLTIGTPASSFSVEFFVIDSLPYSCILGLSFLDQLKSWGVNIDPLNLLCSHMQHLPSDQFFEAKQVLSDFKDVFSVSNTQIIRTNTSSFDVELEHNHPISVPLQQVPLHQQDIVRSLLQQYKDLGLIEHIDSPYHAATVLVEKKMSPTALT